MMEKYYFLRRWAVVGATALVLSACASQSSLVTTALKQDNPNYQAGVAAYNEHKYAKALDIWVELADQGDAEATNALGMMYQSGKGVARDVGVAARLYKKAASAGLPEAQNNLAVMYESGEGVSKDLEKAVQLYQRSANQGYVWAQYNLGRIHESGLGVAKDAAAAQEYFKQADQAKSMLGGDDQRPNR